MPLETAKPPSIPFTFRFSRLTSANGIGLAALATIDGQLGGLMTRARWFLLGAVGLGVVIVMYVVFFCPADCQ